MFPGDGWVALGSGGGSLGAPWESRGMRQDDKEDEPPSIVTSLITGHLMHARLSFFGFDHPPSPAGPLHTVASLQHESSVG